MEGKKTLTLHSNYFQKNMAIQKDLDAVEALKHSTLDYSHQPNPNHHNFQQLFHIRLRTRPDGVLEPELLTCSSIAFAFAFTRLIASWHVIPADSATLVTKL
ncbi:hypothetical protein Dimus_002813 [Dionaea muscipula]